VGWYPGRDLSNAVEIRVKLQPLSFRPYILIIDWSGSPMVTGRYGRVPILGLRNLEE
jgi:hypothetical protein